MPAPETPNRDPETDRPPRQRRWIPLALKAFVVILVCLAGASVVTIGVRHYKITTTLETIKSAGGRCELRPGGPNWLRSWIGESWMLGFDEITAINLGNSAATDETVAAVMNGKALLKLELRETKITDEGLKGLERLSNLQELGLDLTQTSDAGLIHLNELPNLQTLRLSGNQITDAGLIHLHDLTGL